MNAARLTQLLHDGVTAAEEHLPALETAYRAALKTAGIQASRRFERFTVDHLTADASNPSWTPPENDQLLNQTELAADANRRAKAAHRAALKAVLEPVLADIGIAYDIRNSFVARLADKLGARAADLGDAIRGDIAKTILASYQDGLSVTATAKAIRAAVDDVSAVRAAMLARTDLVGLANGASLAAAQLVSGDGQVGFKQWLATEDERTRDSHADADGQVVPVDQPFEVGGEQLMYPGDPDGSDAEVCNCFPAETAVMFPGLRAAMRRWYEGNLVSIRLATGDVLSGTPNHPVLRSDGRWTPLSLVEEGDDLIRAVVGRKDVGTPDPDRRPTEIGEVYRLARSCAEAERVRLRPADFHGDGADGEVEVVPIEGSLFVDGEAASDEEIAEFGLALADHARAPLSESEGLAFARSDAAAVSSTTCLVRTTRQRATLLVGHGGEANEVSLSTVADGESEIAVECTDDRRPTYPGGLRDGEDAFTLFVAAAKVVEVKVRAFHGPVFNLDTGYGWYTANGVVSANCRCTLVYLDASDVAGTAGDLAAAGVTPTDAVASRGRMDESPDATLTADVTVTVSDDASAEAAAMTAPPVKWRAILCVEGEPSQDGPSLVRMLKPGGGTWRDLPLPLGVMFETPHSDEAHAEVCGRIDSIYRDAADQRIIWGEGEFNTDEIGCRAAEMVGNLSLRGVSIDPYVALLEVTEPATPNPDDAEEMDTQEVEPTLLTFAEYVIGGATICPFQALASATIEIVPDAEGEMVQPRVVTASCFVLTVEAPGAVSSLISDGGAWIDGVDSLSGRLDDLARRLEEQEQERRADGDRLRALVAAAVDEAAVPKQTIERIGRDLAGIRDELGKRPRTVQFERDAEGKLLGLREG